MDQENSDDGREGDTSEIKENGMDVDGDDQAEASNNNHEGLQESLSDAESDDGENPEDVAMVPLADILNAKYGTANVRRTFYLYMVTD